MLVTRTAIPAGPRVHLVGRCLAGASYNCTMSLENCLPSCSVQGVRYPLPLALVPRQVCVIGYCRQGQVGLIPYRISRH